METKERSKKKFSFEKEPVNLGLVGGQILNSAIGGQRSLVKVRRSADV